MSETRKTLNDFEKMFANLARNANKNLSEEEISKLVYEFMCEEFPAYKELYEKRKEYENSDAFAYFEIERLRKHIDEKHGKKAGECAGTDCFEGYDINLFKEYTTRVYKGVMKHLEEELKKQLKKEASQ